MRVLVVEDNIDFWIGLQTFLAAKGHTCFWASKAIQAVRWLMREPMDLVLLDVDLGEGEPSGLDVVRTMMQDENLAKIPRILISGMSAAQIRERERIDTIEVLQHVHPVILGKPFDLAELELEMVDAVRRGGLASVPPKRSPKPTE